MTAREKREKVIKGMEHCIQYDHCGDECHTCVYYEECATNGATLIRDAFDLLKAQEPRLVTEADFENADEYGFIPAWYEGLINKEGWWNCIPKEALETAKEDGCRYWTAKPSLKQMEETPWE